MAKKIKISAFLRPQKPQPPKVLPFRIRRLKPRQVRRIVQQKTQIITQVSKPRTRALINTGKVVYQKVSPELHFLIRIDPWNAPPAGRRWEYYVDGKLVAKKDLLVPGRVVGGVVAVPTGRHEIIVKVDGKVIARKTVTVRNPAEQVFLELRRNGLVIQNRVVRPVLVPLNQRLAREMGVPPTVLTPVTPALRKGPYEDIIKLGYEYLTKYPEKAKEFLGPGMNLEVDMFRSGKLSRHGARTLAYIVGKHVLRKA